MRLYTFNLATIDHTSTTLEDLRRATVRQPKYLRHLWCDFDAIYAWWCVWWVILTTRCEVGCVSKWMCTPPVRELMSSRLRGVDEMEATGLACAITTNLTYCGICWPANFLTYGSLAGWLAREINDSATRPVMDCIVTSWTACLSLNELDSQLFGKPAS